MASKGIGSVEHDAAVSFLTADHFAHISKWYPAVEEWTMPTRFIEISDETAKALGQLVRLTRQAATQPPEPAEAPEATAAEPAQQRAFSLLKEPQQRLIEALTEQIQQAIESLPRAAEGGAFVRLDTRSPKDGIFLLPRVRSLLTMMIGSRQFDSSSSPECEEYDASCFHRAMIEGLKVRSGAEALELLAHSQRVEADLIGLQIANKGSGHCQLVVRQWDARIDPMCEVRAFVFAGQVTAISQYYETCRVPALLAQPTQVVQLVTNLIAQLQPRLESLVTADPQFGEAFYTADIALICQQPSSQQFDSCVLIEINPPPPVAGTILFPWSQPEARSVITTPQPQPVLRLVQDHVAWSSIPFHPPLKEFIDQLRGRSHSSCQLL